jgi:hypothetical protein
MEYLIDLRELQLLMESFSDSLVLDDFNFNESFENAIPELNLMNGINNTHLAGNPEKFIFGIGFEFEDINSLNQALGLLFEDDENTTTVFVEKKRKKFIRYDAKSDKFSHEAMMEEGLDIDESVMKDILNKMKYQIFMNFEREIKRVKTQASYEKDSKFSIFLEANFNQMLENADLLETIVKTR